GLQAPQKPERAAVQEGLGGPAGHEAWLLGEDVRPEAEDQPVASLLGLVLLLLKAAQLYLHRQWLLKALQQFPSPPSHWLYGHMQE
ncbi:hypothetical protein EI555_007247, partial [Monodon monoceros]